MIPRSHPLVQTPLWQTELRRGFSKPAELLKYLQLDGHRDLIPTQGEQDFPLRVPRGFAARMHKGRPDDPLLLQVLPLAAEDAEVPGFSADPLNELASMPSEGLLHKYQGRALLTLTGACGIHCRYCFRRHFPYAEANPGTDDWRAAIAYLQKNPDIEEIILSGGDPLCVSDTRLAALIAQLETIPHLQRLRIHTRLPVVLPERVDAHLTAWLRHTRLLTVMVIHANHPHEIDDTVVRALHELRVNHVQLLNQSVLLRRVNDNAATLTELSTRLFAAGVLPYYLHMLDPVQGAAHFDVPEAHARELLQQIHGRLPGYLVPRLVREIPDQAGKIPVWP